MSLWRSFSPPRRLATTVCGFVCCPAWDPMRTALLRRDTCDGRGNSWTWHDARSIASRLVRCEETAP